MFHVKQSGSCCASIRQTGSRNSLISLGFSRSSASACRKLTSKNSKSSAPVSSEPSQHSPCPRIGARRHDSFFPTFPKNPFELHPRFRRAYRRGGKLLEPPEDCLPGGATWHLSPNPNRGR